MKNKYVEAYEVIAEMQDIESALAFLETLPKSEYVNFGKELVKMAKYGDDGGFVVTGENSGTWQRHKPQEYVEVLFFGCLKTCSYTTFTKHRSWQGELFFKEITKAFFVSNCPKWLTKYFNNDLIEWITRNHYFDFKIYQEKGFITSFNPELRAMSLSALPSTYKHWDTENRKTIFEIDKFYTDCEKYFDWIKSDIPLLFQFENGFGGHYDWTRDNWYVFLKKWSEEGKIERTDLIKWTFETFHRPFNRQAASVYRKFLDFLELTDSEKINHQNDYLETLSNANPQHVSYALKEIKKIEKINGFDYETLVESLEPILVEDSKGTVKNALMLLERTAKKRKDLIPQICKMSLFALVSEEVDIQERVLKLLEKYASPNDEELSDELSIFYENIHATLQPKFQVFLTENVDLVVEETVEFKPKTIDILSDEFKIEYIENWDNWIYAASSAYESGNVEVIDFERLMEGFARLSQQKTKDVLQKFEPIIQRIEKTIGRHWGTSHNPIAAFIITAHQLLQKMPSSWATIETKFLNTLAKFYTGNEAKRPDIVINRMSLFLYFAFKKQQLPILSLPTHHSIWIHPTIFVDKILMYQQHEIQPNAYDLSYAIGRLCFQRTEEAFVKASKIKGKLGELIRWILKGDINDISPKTIKDLKPSLIEFPKSLFGESIAATYHEKDSIVWFNALRTRFPMQDMDVFLDWKFGKNYPNTAIAQSYKWETTKEVSHYYNSDYTYHKIKISQKIKENTSKSLPFRMLYFQNTYYSNDLLLKLWLSFVPNNPEMLFYQIVPSLSSALHSYEDVESNKQSRLLLRSMIDLNVSIYPMVLLFLATSVNCTDKISRAIATEVIIHSINQKRIEAVKFGAYLGRLMPTEFGKLQRIIPCLQQVSEVSAHHALFIKAVIEAMLAEFPTDVTPRNTKKLLELLVNISLSENEKISSELFQKQIEFWKTKSGLKKLVKGF